MSALEEGTPEFYQSIGLQPPQERYDMLADAGIAPESPEGKNVLWSQSLNGDVATVYKRAVNKLVTSSWQKTT